MGPGSIARLLVLVALPDQMALGETEPVFLALVRVPRRVVPATMLLVVLVAPPLVVLVVLARSTTPRMDRVAGVVAGWPTRQLGDLVVSTVAEEVLRAAPLLARRPRVLALRA